MASLSPMMQQYFRIKEQHQDEILFFRLGDFYEMFFDDAKLASRELELTLTGRDCGLDERAPMCGVPYHSCEAYIARLIKKGYKVAICEQMEDPATAKGLVQREVIRVITPGTLMESNMLSEEKNNYLASLYWCEDGVGLAFVDISTGEACATQLAADEAKLIGELGRFSPSEALYNTAAAGLEKLQAFLTGRLACAVNPVEESAYDFAAFSKAIEGQFGSTINELGLAGVPLCVFALGSLLDYLGQTQRHGLERLQELEIYTDSQYMKLDLTARRNLEVLETLRSGERRGSLLWVLDKTKTAMGKRLMRRIICQPLISPPQIERRLHAVEELHRDQILCSALQEQLADIHDMERLMTRIVYSNATPRDLVALGRTAEKIPAVRALLDGVKSKNLTQVLERLDPLEDVKDSIFSTIVENPPINLKEGGVICAGRDARLDELRQVSGNVHEVMAAMEAREREETGIKKLKVGYNSVFGYYLEVPKSAAGQVPDHFVRKQTLVNSERYITQELKELEEKIFGAAEEILKLENQLYEELRLWIAAQLHRIQATAEAVAWLDVYASLARVACENGYCCPQVDYSEEIYIKEGRHPVVEQLLRGDPFVSNDTLLDCGEHQIAVITGPNMAGKSTYMRQAALIVLMAQIGSFVPAQSARIGVVDGIYTRVGASDDLATGQSTFMVEMNEVADILKNATRRSLLILDEIGRGTSTFDGMSIARSVIEYIADPKKLGAKTMFATHYHELTALEEAFSCVKNYNIACKKRGDDIIFLRRILPGGTDDSYGIEVAKLAGVPDWIVKRAHAILKELESGAQAPSAAKAAPAGRQEEQMTLGGLRDGALAEALQKLDIDTLTPIEALLKLSELKKML